MISQNILHRKLGNSINVEDLRIMATKEKCEFCGCRGGSTICYYNCGCHKPKDEKVLPKK